MHVVDFSVEFNMSSTFNLSYLRRYYPPETEDPSSIALGERPPDAKHPGLLA